jgi:VWFA-related protein
MKPFGRLVLLIGAACVMALPFLAGARQEVPSSIFGEEIDVRVVNLEVVVTDRRGNRVTDLKPGDFRVLVDGKPASIDFFTEIREGMALAPATASAEVQEATPPEPTTGVAPSVEPGGPVGVNYLVFVDDFFSVARLRNDVLESLKKDLPARLGPRDRMSVVAWDGGRLARLTDWTGSREEIAKALDAAMARPTRGLMRSSEFRSFISSQSLSGKAPGGDLLATGEDVTGSDRMFDSGMGMLVYSYAEMLARQLSGASTAVASAMRGSVPPSGRKVVLLLGGGWPFSIQSYIQGSSGVLIGKELPSGEELLRPMTNAANRLGYTIYPVDVPGLSSVAADASVNPMEGRSNSAKGLEVDMTKSSAALERDNVLTVGSDPQPMPPAFTDTGNLREQELEGSLEFIAEETGLELAGADTRSYYWLGFTPSWQGNDQRHKVRIEVLRPGLRARSRTSFLDMSRQSETAMKVESAMLFGGVPGSEPMAIRTGMPKPWKKGRTRGVQVPVTLEIPMSAVTVIPVDGVYAAEVELRFAASDRQGNQSDLPVLPVRLSSSQPPGSAKVLRYQTNVFISGEAQHLVAAVYDRASGKIAAAEADIAKR